MRAGYSLPVTALRSFPQPALSPGAGLMERETATLVPMVPPMMNA